MKALTIINIEAIPHVAITAINHILGLEGGYVNDPFDKGGKTNFGISDLRDGVSDGLVDINLDGLGDVAPKDLTYEQAVSIYYSDYWLANKCHLMPEYIALMVFDTAVNQGGNFARKTLQHALGVKADGIIGGMTLAALQEASSLKLLTDYVHLRLLRYSQLAHKKPNQTKFLAGWVNRTFAVFEQCQITSVFGADN